MDLGHRSDAHRPRGIRNVVGEMKLELMVQALTVMFPELMVRTAIEPGNVEMGTADVSLEEWLRSAEDFPNVDDR